MLPGLIPIPPSALTEVMISQAAGTIITDLFVNTPGAAFDGVQISTAGASTSANQGVARIGKDLGSPRVISGVKVWGLSNSSYYNGAISMTFALKGSNTDPATTAWTGTTIDTIPSFATDNATSQPKQVLGALLGAAFRYVWVESTPARYFAEIEFYELVS